MKNITLQTNRLKETKNNAKYMERNLMENIYVRNLKAIKRLILHKTRLWANAQEIPAK